MNIMSRFARRVIVAGMAALLAGCAAGPTVELSREQFVDKCKGAWAGQVIGVTFGAPTEFRSCAKPIKGDLPIWTPDMVKNAIKQDDCYVEMTFLKAIEDYGLDVTHEEAGKAFGESKYRLWHANRAGRDNIREGIMPPWSGHPLFNRHADDIDFQIEADLLGILCPGMPQESNRLCDIFGRIMNYGDGLYGGMFVAGMYSAAYFEDEDVEKVVWEGLGCIPADSQYYRCIADVIRWYHENPNDWLVTWQKIEDKWQDNLDCAPGKAFNIDAKLNGAYIAMGLMYGQGDIAKTLEIATRCGQDSDCNPSNAMGVLCCMKGFSKLGPEWTSGFAAMADTNFDFTEYSFNTLIPACQRVTEQIIAQEGGRVTADGYLIVRQKPAAAPLEQWLDEKELLLSNLPQPIVDLWDPAWKVVACGKEQHPGYRPNCYGRKGVLVIHPVSKTEPAVLEQQLEVPLKDKVTLEINVASNKEGDFQLKVFVDDKVQLDTIVATKGEWTTQTVDLSKFSGKRVYIRIEDHSNDWNFESAYLDSIKVK